ncbi:DUF350 domain-containing protein [Gordonia sp. Z-3]|uniref:DUF350 domain-containing protein n=1 Tax=Gordonia tangerina TaxID=2911060 RepID=A0ABS9DPX2_9ACTN|nr:MULTISPECIES: DUF350 domain-containing protein [Gordonia]MAU81668.1 DUF350 domain-containing protein [Gordonia sp. (in: high G+C Gram-positive bacteria)]MCF3941269.1 DUF350 domain-containing protein [Gordonia tangerina]MED5800439.1 DUF350 domain-containing protein [Gordonia sp. Z-3]
MDQLRDNLGDAAAYSLVGIALLIAGFVALDLVTPGRLRNLIWLDHNRNAVMLATAQVIGLSIVLVAGARDSLALELWRGVLYTAIYVLLAIAVMMWSFVLIDWLTPGKLGTLLLEDDGHPAGWICGAVFIGIGAVIGAAIGL